MYFYSQPVPLQGTRRLLLHLAVRWRYVKLDLPCNLHPTISWRTCLPYLPGPQFVDATGKLSGPRSTTGLRIMRR